MQHGQKDGAADTQSLTCTWLQPPSFANSSITGAEHEGRRASGGGGDWTGACGRAEV